MQTAKNKDVCVKWGGGGVGLSQNESCLGVGLCTGQELRSVSRFVGKGLTM